MRHGEAAGKKAAIDVGKLVGPGAEVAGGALGSLRIHGAEDFADDFVGVRGIPCAHLLNGGGEQAAAVENIGIFGEEAEDQAGHEVVHFVALRGTAPVWIVFEQFNVEPVEAAGGTDVEGAVADLLDGSDAGQRQEEAEVIGEIRVGTGDGFAGFDFFGFKAFAIGSENEAGFGPAGGGAVFERCQGFAYFA